MTRSVAEPVDGLVEANWLAENLRREDVVIFDCTTNIVVDAQGVEQVVAERGAFLQAHIPGAQFIDLQGELSDPDAAYHFMLPDAAQFELALRKFGVNADSTVVIYSTGNPWWATRIWWMFRQFGLDNAFVLNGGLRHWQRLSLPIETGAGRPRPVGSIKLGLARDLVIDGDTLLGRLGQGDFALVNALPPDKFSGKSPVHGGRPGHIPGSVNVPATSLIDPDTGLFLAKEELAEILNEKRLLDPQREVIAYCGGGISASQVVFALARLGQDKVKLYDASLSEWAHRDGFPLHTSIDK